jgi:hypothetical protein
MVCARSPKNPKPKITTNRVLIFYARVLCAFDVGSPTRYSQLEIKM